MALPNLFWMFPPQWNCIEHMCEGKHVSSPGKPGNMQEGSDGSRTQHWSASFLLPIWIFITQLIETLYSGAQIQIKWLLTLKCSKNGLCICQSTSVIDEAVLKTASEESMKRKQKLSICNLQFSIISGISVVLPIYLFLHLSFFWVS